MSDKKRNLAFYKRDGTPSNEDWDVYTYMVGFKYIFDSGKGDPGFMHFWEEQRSRSNFANCTQLAYEDVFMAQYSDSEPELFFYGLKTVSGEMLYKISECELDDKGNYVTKCDKHYVGRGGREISLRFVRELWCSASIQSNGDIIMTKLELWQRDEHLLLLRGIDCDYTTETEAEAGVTVYTEIQKFKDIESIKLFYAYTEDKEVNTQIQQLVKTIFE